MRILSITAQKPDCTGSGIFLSELIKGFAEMGVEQAVVAGIYKDDIVILPDEVAFKPVYFNTVELPFAIAGMSDEMPYESTVYSKMTKDMVSRFEQVFVKNVTDVIEKFNPDLILCHHLYLLTALVRNKCVDKKIVGICHGTDLRQIKKNTLKSEYIKEQIGKLDMIFALHEDQKKDIIRNYDVEASKIEVIGTGYNSKIFHYQPMKKDPSQIKIIYAGKLARAKGIMSLIKCLDYLPYRKEKVVLKLAGGYGNHQEYSEICELIATTKYKVEVLGRLTQEQLALEFNQCDIFVLPSFYEGLPLVIMEALACGLQVIATDLPGVRTWMNHNIPNNGIIFVKVPVMNNTDEPRVEELPMYEQLLAEAIKKSIKLKETGVKNREIIDLENLSWKGICKRIYCKMFV